MVEFGWQVMLKVMDKVSGGVMQERWVEGTLLGRRLKTLAHLVARKSDGVVVRTRAVSDFLKSPTLEDLETVPEPEEHRPAAIPDPSGRVPRAVYITRTMLERHGTCRLPQAYGGCFGTG